MKIGVVGGSGNISIPFVKLLIEQGHDVTCFNRGKAAGLPKGAKAITGDRAQREDFERTMQAQKFDAAIDMICFTAEEARSSVRAFRGVKHFVQCSTVCTYGIQYDWFSTTEDHSLRPISDYGRNKVAADNVFMAAYHDGAFPVTIIKPSTTYGPKMGALRQVAWEMTWIDRVRKGKPIAICGDGQALHQFLHVEDAALCFANVVGKAHCIGQTYNMVKRGFTTWADYHRTAMKVLGKQVELVGVPLANLRAVQPAIPGVGICTDIFAWSTYYSAEKLFRDVPEFQPRISLEQGLTQVIEQLDREGRVPLAETNTWEDKLIEAQRRVGTA